MQPTTAASSPNTWEQQHAAGADLLGHWVQLTRQVQQQQQQQQQGCPQPRTWPGASEVQETVHKQPPGMLGSQAKARNSHNYSFWGGPRAYSSAAAAAAMPDPVRDTLLQLQLQHSAASTTAATNTTPGSSSHLQLQELPSLQDLLESEEQRQRGGKHHFSLAPEQRAWLRDALTRMTGAADSKQRALEAYIPAKVRLSSSSSVVLSEGMKATPDVARPSKAVCVWRMLRRKCGGVCQGCTCMAVLEVDVMSISAPTQCKSCLLAVHDQACDAVSLGMPSPHCSSLQTYALPLDLH
jgi:hypothetical protein